MNTIKTTFLMTVMVVLFLFVGNLLGGTSGMTIALIFALVLNFSSYWFSDKIVLKMYKATEITRENSPKFFDLVEKLSNNAGIPMPKVYIIDNPTPNAFATGRNPEHAAIAATTGILNGLDYDELAGVIAHELSHIKNRDILIGTVASTVVGTITFLAQMAGWAMMFSGRGRDERDGISTLFLIILAPIAATLLQLAISRSREFAADKGSAEICRKPLALASALEKISLRNQQMPITKAGPATAHLFIVNPLRLRGVKKLFSTHPSTEERINKLNELSNKMNLIK